MQTTKNTIKLPVELPIYKTTYDLYLRAMIAIKNFPKSYRYNLGDRLQNELIELLSFVINAQVVKSDRAIFLGKIIEKIQVIELLFRTCKDLQLINVKRFSETVELSDNILRQARGWLKSSKGQAES